MDHTVTIAAENGEVVGFVHALSTLIDRRERVEMVRLYETVADLTIHLRERQFTDLASVTVMFLCHRGSLTVSFQAPLPSVLRPLGDRLKVIGLSTFIIVGQFVPSEKLERPRDLWSHQPLKLSVNLGQKSRHKPP